MESNGIVALLNFELAWDHHPFLLILFEMRMCIICLSHCGILRAHNLSDFTDSQLPQDESIILPISLYLT